jgi:CRP/FNR family transcriptional regulator, cyclic AMP receptor protein
MPPSMKELAARFPAIASHAAGADLSPLLAALVEQPVAAGEVVLAEDEPSDRLYFLWEGEMSVGARSDGAVLDLGRLSPGALFGEVSFVDGGPVSAQVRAVGPSIVLRLDRAAMDALATRSPRLATAVLRTLSDALAARIRSSTLRVEEIAGAGGPAESTARERGLLDGLRRLFGLGKE